MFAYDTSTVWLQVQYSMITKYILYVCTLLLIVQYFVYDSIYCISIELIMFWYNVLNYMNLNVRVYSSLIFI